MFTGFDSILLTSVSLETVLLNLTMALFCGILISLFYRFIYYGPNYSASFVQAMVALSMITVLVIMVIGNNLARAFGLVGAMSIIRFRTAVKDMQDIVFIFFSLSAGMACGVGLRLIAFGGTVFVGLTLLFLSKSGYARPKQFEFLLQFDCTLKEDENLYLPVLKRFCASHKLVNIQGLNNGDNFEISFYIRLKNQSMSTLLSKELQRIEGISRVRLYHEESQESV